MTAPDRLGRSTGGILIGLLFTVMMATPAHADKRIALVIGNSAYRNVARLDNPKNDAKLMADTLRDVGFSLVGGGPQFDLDKAGFDQAIQAFSNQLQGADVALFYYAGHGLQVRNSNYLVPVGADPVREADVFLQMVDITLVLSQMEDSGSKLNLVILDACRNNPFGGRRLRATESGLAQMRAPEGTLIAYATQPGSVAKDGEDGNSPYTKALVQTIRRPGLDIFRTFNEVGLAVIQATGNEQQPWVSNSPIKGNFYFTSPPAQQPAASSNANEQTNVTELARLQAELAKKIEEARIAEAEKAKTLALATDRVDQKSNDAAKANATDNKSTESQGMLRDSSNDEEFKSYLQSQRTFKKWLQQERDSGNSVVDASVGFTLGLMANDLAELHGKLTTLSRADFHSLVKGKLEDLLYECGHDKIFSIIKQDKFDANGVCSPIREETPSVTLKKQFDFWNFEFRYKGKKYNRITLEPIFDEKRAAKGRK